MINNKSKGGKGNNIFIKILLIISLISNNVIKDNFIYKQVNEYQKIKTNYSTLKIFIMTHKDFDNIRFDPVYNIVVNDKTELKNNYSLNIIYANEGKLYNMSRAYGEMSKLYYIYQLYKNETISSKYIGLNHYRRNFVFKDNIPYIEYIFKKHDVILTKQMNLHTSIRKQFCLNHICRHYDEMINIIKEIKPEYYKTAKRISRGRKFYIGNIFIMKKEDFFKYCNFMFDILFEFDKRNSFNSDNDVLEYMKKIYDNSTIYYYQSRLEGFLSERLSNIFFNKYFKRIKTYDIFYYNT